MNMHLQNVALAEDGSRAHFTRIGHATIRVLLIAMAPVFGAACVGAPLESDTEQEPLAEAMAALAIDPDTISAGRRHTCALRSTDGSVFCWGSNTTDTVANVVVGKLGDGSTSALLRATPVQVKQVQVNGLPFTGAIQVSAGGHHTCAVKADGTVWCWGANNAGQLGIGSTNGNANPVPVQVLNLSGVTQVSAGGDHTCAVQSNGTAWCWGRDVEGQLGDTLHTGNRPAPVKVEAPGGGGALQNVTQISAGDLHSCAVTGGSGNVYCWGSNGNGRLGIGTEGGSSETAVQVVKGPSPFTALSGITQIDAGATHTCAVGSGGGIWCWGENKKGALGDNTVANKPYAVPVIEAVYTNGQETGTQALSGAISVSVGEEWGSISSQGAHSCALKSDGSAWCWGDNAWAWDGSLTARLGYDGTMSKIAKPVRDSANNPFSQVASIDVGSFHTCAAKNNGTVFCWGNNDKGQLGLGAPDNDSHTRPARVVSYTKAKLAGGANHTCALSTDGTVRCWGGNGTDGLLGNGTTLNSPTPVQVIVSAGNPLRDISDIDVGHHHTCAVRRHDNTAWCWGLNNAGQLGNGYVGSAYNSSVAVQVQKSGGGLLTNVTRIGGGGNFSCAIDSGGSAWCWGENEKGQLGNGTTGTPSGVAVQVLENTTGLPLTDVQQIRVGTSTACALRGNSTVWCWGNNTLGVLGDGTTVNKNKAVQVLGDGGAGPLSNVAGVSVDQRTACARKYDGTVWCWGDGSYGKLGNGGTSNSLFPSQVKISANQVLTGADEIMTAAFHSCAQVPNGKTYCWGFDYYGQTGTGAPGGGTITSVVWATPVKRNDNGADLMGISTLSQSGYMHTCAGDSPAGGMVWCWGANFSSQLGDGTNTNRTKAVLVPNFSMGTEFLTL